MPRTTCCVVVQHPKVFRDFGGQTYLSRALAAIEDVRGIDETVFLSSPALAARVKETLPDAKIFKLPPTMVGMDRWLESGPAEKSDIVLLVQPTSPFMTAGKIEQCLDAVRRRQVDEALTVVEVTARDEVGRPKKAEAATSGGCRAFGSRRLCIASPRKQLQACKGVRVTLTESVDVLLPDQEFMAHAILAKQTSA